MTNMAIEQALKAQGVDFVRAKVGDRYVLEALSANGWQLGAKALGICWPWTSTPRAMVWSVPCRYCRPVCAPARRSRSGWRTCSFSPGHDQCAFAARSGLEENEQLPLAQQEVEKQLGDSGRVLIRASGTEPLLRVMVEARDEAMASNCAERLVQVVKAG